MALYSYKVRQSRNLENYIPFSRTWSDVLSYENLNKDIGIREKIMKEQYLVSA